MNEIDHLPVPVEACPDQARHPLSKRRQDKPLCYTPAGLGTPYNDKRAVREPNRGPSATHRLISNVPSQGTGSFGSRTETATPLHGRRGECAPRGAQLTTTVIISTVRLGSAGASWLETKEWRAPMTAENEPSMHWTPDTACDPLLRTHDVQSAPRLFPPECADKWLLVALQEAWARAGICLQAT